MNHSAITRNIIFLCMLPMASCLRAQQIEPRLEKDVSGIQAERKQTDRLMQAAKLHVWHLTPKEQAFMKVYKRSSDVVEASMLGFLSDSNQSPDAFMKKALETDSWKKPMNTSLSFVLFLRFRTAHDWFRLNYVRFHNRGLDLEVDQLSPTEAPEIKETAMAVIELPLGPMSPGSFHYSTLINPGTYNKMIADHPKGWEYSDVNRFAGAASGCTIVDPKAIACHIERCRRSAN